LAGAGVTVVYVLYPVYIEVHHTCDWIAVPVCVKDAEPAKAGRQAQGNQNGDLHVIKVSYMHFIFIKLKDGLMRVR
jgi:hypothetical protein